MLLASDNLKENYKKEFPVLYKISFVDLFGETDSKRNLNHD